MEYDPNETAAYLMGKIDEYVKFGARDTISRNVSNDRYSRWARIPDATACDFCRMLGSRGFVYHSEETAGGGAGHGSKSDDYHPYCNCQIAVTFQPDMQYYVKNGVTVSRGYEGEETYVTATGRDGSDKLRTVDIDQLYKEYLKMGRDFNGGTIKRERVKTGPYELPAKEYDAALDQLEQAHTLEELHLVGDSIVNYWKAKAHGGKLNERQWSELSKRARELERELLQK